MDDKEAVTKLYVDSGFNDSNVIKNTEHVDFNDENLDNVRFVKQSSSCARASYTKVLCR